MATIQRARGHGERGQALLLVAMTLSLLIGVTSLAVDSGFYRYEQRMMQSAADSAAIAGAAELAYGSSSATAAAKADAASNGFKDGSNGVAVSVNTSYSDQYTGSSNAAQVVITKSYPRFFGGVIGGGSTQQITATAVARMSANVKACLYQLWYAGTPNFNGMTYNGHDCGIIMNGTANFNGAHIDAGSIGYQPGKTPNENGATFVQATPAPSTPAIDPCPNIPGCNYLTNNPPPTAPCANHPNYNGANTTLLPGCYNSPNFNGATLRLQPGTYVFSGPPNFNGTTISGSGVTFYFTSGVCANFNGATLNVSPPTSGNTTGVLVYAAPGASGCTPNFNGANTGGVPALVYFAGYKVNYNGSTGGYTVLVCGDANFNGSTQNFPAPAGNQSLIQAPALAE